MHATYKLKAKTRRNRKARLAERDGQHCAYCRSPFATPLEATLDHVAPVSLFRTWSARHLVLACRSCNDRKADRFPLSIALLLLRSVDPTRPVIRPVDLPLLARLAYTNRSTRHLPESTRNPPILERTAA
ncbi:restriction endonuclease [Streptomyces sp. ERV7]|nr:restriction endonuclease [Streptomyces sp. ERV7]